MPLGGLYGVLVGYLIARTALPGAAGHGGGLHAQLRPARHHRGHRLPHRVQRPAAGAHRQARCIIVACYIFRYSPTGIRATVALLQQIDPSAGGGLAGPGRLGPATTFRRVTLPLIAPAFFAGLGVVFIRSMTAISATIFLVSINWTLITVRILENMTELSLGPAAAFSVLVVAIVYVVIAAIGRLLRALRAPGAVSLGGILGG